MNVTVNELHAFTDSTKGGNPAGAVLNADDLSPIQMQSIAAQVGFNETAFVLKSSIANFKLRYFTTVQEVPLCGHATLATLFLLKKLGKVSDSNISIETLSGLIEGEVRDTHVFMNQQLPEFGKILDKMNVADCLQIRKEDIDDHLPVQIVSTGFPTIIIPLKSIDILRRLAPDFEKCKKLSGGKLLIHPFTFETSDSSSIAVMRNYFPVESLDEDAATGTSAGALACYLYRYNRIDRGKGFPVMFEQGLFMNRPSKILAGLVSEEKTIKKVFVGGSVISARQIKVTI